MLAVTTLKVSKARANDLINTAINEAQQLLREANDVVDDETYRTWTQNCERWDARTKAALDSALADSDLPEEFQHAATGRIFTRVNQSEGETFTNRQDAVDRGINTLRSIAERLEFIDGPVEEAPVELRAAVPGGNQVFVVHGRDEAIRERVARLLERLGLEPIILQEQTDRGRTVIEKFEDHALEVGYAVILLTPDDFGRGPDEHDWPEDPNRARQNVILELGYFMGALGRDRVSAIYVEGTDLPSDIHGLLYIRFDADWELRLAREMRDAELDIDLNRL